MDYEILLTQRQVSGSFGACCELPHLCVVTEWMSGSTLRELLSETAMGASESLDPLDWTSGKKKMATDAARGATH